MFTAVLDTSVLWPSLQRDFLLSLAVEQCYRPLWSSAILDELVFHEARKLVGVGLTEDNAELRAERLMTTMSSAFDGALVTGGEPLEGSYSLPDPDDEHVVAAAAKGGAEVIVTSNLNDFPDPQPPDPIRALSPQQFTYDTVRQHVTPACRAVVRICRRSGRKGPEPTVNDVLCILRDRYGMVDAVEVLSSAPGLRSSPDPRPPTGCAEPAFPSDPSATCDVP